MAGRSYMAAACMVVTILAMAGGAGWAWMRYPVSLHGRFPSPDGQFEVRALAYPRRWPFGGFPRSSSGDGPGLVCLYEGRGIRIACVGVEMVGAVDRVRWTERSVEVLLVIEWALPAVDPESGRGRPRG